MLQNTLKNRTIFCSDNLEILENIDSGTIDLIYLDPPFNKKKIFTAPIGSQAEGAEFSDIFRKEDVKDEWVQTIKEDNFELHNFLLGVKGIGNEYNFCYLCYMAIRLIECQRILKDTGSLYLHCDPTMSHGLKMVLDCIFEEENFRNEIVWCYKGASEMKSAFPRKHDIILFYAKTNMTSFFYDEIRIPYKGKNLKPAKWGSEVHKKNPLGTKCLDWFEDIPSFMTASRSKERTGYPTQKPLALLERIIKTSSKEGDIVLDPFCGCATTCVAAEKLGRQWIGIDVSKKAFEIVKMRLAKEIPNELWNNKKIHFLKTKKLKRTDGGGKEKEKKYVYIVLKESELPYYKVGIAKDCKARLSGYKTSDKDRDYTMPYTYLTTNYRVIEKHIHNKFENLHEWVKAPIKEIEEAIKNCDKQIEKSDTIIEKSYSPNTAIEEKKKMREQMIEAVKKEK